MSRESELYKDKIEVSLDGRQIFYLFFGGAVIVGLVFVLGVMVGRRVEARGHVERAHVEATVDPLAALDRLEGGSGLSFQGALRGGDATSDVEKMIGDLAKARPAEAKKPPEKKPAEKPAEAKPVKAKPADKKPVEAKAEPKTEAKPESKPEAKEDKKTAETRSEPKAEDKRVAEAPDAKKSDDKKPRFTLQLSSFHDRADAQAFFDGVKSSGFSPYITEGSVDGKTFYRVRLGGYRTMDAANDAKADFEKSAKKSAQVMRL